MRACSVLRAGRGVCPRRPSPRSSESAGPTWEDWNEIDVHAARQLINIRDGDIFGIWTTNLGRLGSQGSVPLE